MPVKFGGHVHIAIWFTTSQRAFVPQVLSHGLIQRCLTQALFIGHSELIIHSGRQPKYGSPLYSGKHVHIPLSQTELGPQGDGLHELIATGSGNKTII